jgi:ACDE family multidrug resistance protein
VRGSPRASLVLAVATASSVMFGIQGIAAALPAIQPELGISDSALALFTAMYLLPGVLFAIPLGYLTDSLGRRRVFVSMAVLYGVAGVAQTWAPDYETILVLRFVQGIGFAALNPLSITLIGDAFEGAAQLRAQSTRQIAIAVTEFSLPLVAAALTAVSWQAPLAAQAVTLPLALAGMLLLPRRPEREQRPQRYGVELGAAVRQAGMPAVLTAGFVRFVCKFAVVAYLPVLLVGRGATLAQAALVLSVGSGVAALVNLPVARLAARLRVSRMIIASVVLVGGSLFAFAIAPSWELAVVAAVAYGLGDGTMMVLQNALVTQIAPAAIRGGVVAVSSATRNAGKLLAPLTMGALMLAVSTPAAFAAMGLLTWAVVPLLRQLRRVDGLMREEPATLAASDDLTSRVA